MMAFGGDSNQDEVMSEINMTPLVDVMLVLLIIFILAMPVITQSIQVNLPNANAKAQPPPQSLPEAVELTIDDQGRIYWNQQPVSHTQLEDKLQWLAENAKETQLKLRGDRTVEYHYVIDVMSAVKQAGLPKLHFVTEPKSTP